MLPFAPSPALYRSSLQQRRLIISRSLMVSFPALPKEALMGERKNQPLDSFPEPKKRRKVDFLTADPGIEAKDCIKIYLVSSKEEVEAGSGYCIEPVDLNSFFGEDGKIYGYKGLKITFWVSSISFHVYVNISYESSIDGGKGITDLKTAFQDIFGENLVDSRDQFFQTFTNDSNYLWSVLQKGERLLQSASNGISSHSNGNSEAEAPQAEVIRLAFGDIIVGQLYSRLVPLVLLLVDGSSPIDVVDPRWELYIIVKKTGDEEACKVTLLGLATVYRFHHYPESSRLRLGQILILPPNQQKGYGSSLLVALNSVAISEDVYDFTIEEPLDSLQHVRNCLDVPRLLSLPSVEQAIESVKTQLKDAKLSKRTAAYNVSQLLPPPSTVDDVRKSLKINKKQFLHCWEILVYIALDPADHKDMENYETFIADQVKADVIGKDSGVPTGKKVVDVPSDYDQETSFVMFKAQDGEGVVNIEMDEEQVASQVEQLKKLVEERLERIKSVAKKLSSRG